MEEGKNERKAATLKAERESNSSDASQVPEKNGVQIEDETSTTRVHRRARGPEMIEKG